MGSSSLASRTHWVILDVFLDLRGHLSAHTLGAGGTPLLRRHAGCVRTPDITHAAEGTPLSALPPSGLFKLIYLLTYFWLCWVLVAALGLCSSCGERGLPLVAGYRRLTAVAPLVAEQSFEGTRAAGLEARAQLPRGTWDLSGPRVGPVSPALAGGFLTAHHQGSPLPLFKKSFSPPLPQSISLQSHGALQAQGPSGVSPAPCHW